MKTDNQDRNLERLLQASCKPVEPSFEDRLARLVAEEVRACRPRRREWKKWSAGMAAAAALAFAAWLAWPSRPGPAGPVGAVQAAYGTILLGDRSLDAAGREEPLAPGEWLQTLSGSRATITLDDHSRLTARARSRLSVETPADGAKVRLDHGFISVQAARQAPGKHLSVELPGGTLRVLGTEFDVHATEQEGRRTSRVTVASGRVEVASGGKRVTVLPNTEAVFQEGGPPEVRPLAPQVRELARLQEEADAQAVAAGAPIDSVALIDVGANGTATVWFRTRVPKGATTYLFPAPSPRLRAYTMDGVPIPVNSRRAQLPPGAEGLVATAPLPREMVRAEDKHQFRVRVPDTASTSRTLVRVRLPEAARLDNPSPEPARSGASGTRPEMTYVLNLDVNDLIGSN